MCRGWTPTGPEMSSYLAAKGGCFVHRVVELSGGAVVTRGDSMLDADPPVALSDVLGRVESIERGGSRVAMAERVSGGRRAAGAVLGQSGRLARINQNVLPDICVRLWVHRNIPSGGA